MKNKKLVEYQLLSDLYDSLSSMISYADDGSLSRYDSDYSDFFEELDKANENLNKLDKILYEEKGEK